MNVCVRTNIIISHGLIVMRKNLMLFHANKKGLDQPVNLQSLTFTINWPRLSLLTPKVPFEIYRKNWSPEKT